MTTENKALRILSIDAWRNACGGWDWNQWFNAGTIDADQFAKIEKSPRQLFKWFRENGKLTAGSAGSVALDDDGYNLVIVQKSNRMPLFAIEYGRDQ